MHILLTGSISKKTMFLVAHVSDLHAPDPASDMKHIDSVVCV